jgi:hypothetical protein
MLLHLLTSAHGTKLPKRCAALCLELAKADVHLTGICPGDLTEQMQSRAASASTSARGYPLDPLGYSMTSSALSFVPPDPLAQLRFP